MQNNLEQRSWNVIFQKVIIIVTVPVQLQKLNKFGGFINRKFNLKCLIYTDIANYTLKSNINLEKSKPNVTAIDLTFILMSIQVLKNCNKTLEKVEF